jgi:chromosome segregation ATPase
MAIKILLILALLTGGGSIAVSHFMVKPRIEKAEKAEKDNMAKYTAEQAAKARVQGELNETKQVLDTTKSELETTKTTLASTSAELDKSKQDVAKLNGDVAKAKAETARVVSESKEFFELKMTVAQIKKLRDDLPKVTKERDVFTAENKVLQVEVNRLKNKMRELDRNSLIAPAVRLPAGLTGKVISVDPRYEFVILNIGGKAGALVDGEMVITRGGEMVGKVRIASVEPDYSVANVIQSWKKKDAVEGDTVLVQ